MRIALDNLPTDVSVLHQLVRDMAGALDESEIEAERLRLIIRQFQRASFGRRSEQLDPDQMAFGLEELEADLARAEARKPSPASGEPAKVKTTPHRSPLPTHLPRVEDVLPVPHDACPDCGGALSEAGSTSSEMLDWIPAQLRVIRVTRPKCACRACGTLLDGALPVTLPISRGGRLDLLAAGMRLLTLRGQIGLLATGTRLLADTAAAAASDTRCGRVASS